MLNQLNVKNPTNLKILCSLALTLTTSVFIYPQASKAGEGVPSELQGEWRYGRISSIQYQNSYTGAPAQPNGASDQFTLTADGSYERARLLQINTYGCASNLFISEKGKVTIEGQQFTFQPTESLAKGQSCSAANSYETKNSAKPETYGWSVETNEYGQQVLVLETADGQGKAHYGRPQ